jgi:hypothetical protein
LIAIIALLIVLVMVFFVNRDQRQNRLSPLAGLAFACTIAGILFGDSPYIGYGLILLGNYPGSHSYFRISETEITLHQQARMLD